MPESRVFLDTGFAIAMVSRRDAFHEKALQLAGELNAAGTTIVTTRAVLLEIGAALAKVAYRKAAVALIDLLENDPKVEILPLSEDLFAQSFALFRTRTDKEWSLTDCLSFVVMRQRGIQAALAADIHFQQAGFKALLLE